MTPQDRVAAHPQVPLDHKPTTPINNNRRDGTVAPAFNRLTTVAPAIARDIQTAPPSVQRSIARAAVEHAFATSPNANGYRETLAALDHGDPTQLRQQLRQEWLNHEALTDDTLEAGDHATSKAHAQYAAALATAYYALAPDPAEAALESVHEARGSLAPSDQLDARIHALITNGAYPN